MVKLLIARHGQTQWNTQHRMQGQNDSPLTETGIELARRLSLRLEGVKLDGVITSPLGRAVDTARILAGRSGAPITEDARLMELDLGKWEGEDMRHMEQRYPIDFEWFWQDPNRYMEIRGGETYDALLARTASLLDELAARGEGTYLLVTHAIALRSIRQNALGLATDASRMSMPSCCLCQLDLNGRERDLVLFGDRYHHDDSIMHWWHGSPERMDMLRAGSTITRIRPLAQAFSHKPAQLELDTYSAITHNGTQPGWLYRIAEPVSAEDVVQHPRTAMPLTYEFITRRDLKVECICATDPAAALGMPADDPGLTLKI